MAEEDNQGYNPYQGDNQNYGEYQEQYQGDNQNYGDYQGQDQYQDNQAYQGQDQYQAEGNMNQDNQGYEQPAENQGYENQGYEQPAENQGYENQGYEQPAENQGYEQPAENQGYEQPAYEQPPKEYKPPSPTIQNCIQLNQLMPVKDLEKTIDAISNPIYDYDDLLNEFLQKVDTRTSVCNDDDNPFIKCEQNREGDSYRSPKSNKFFPPTDEGRYPSPKLRELEQRLNAMFRQYTKLYYSSSAISSCYCWDLGSSIEEGFGVAAVIKNVIDNVQSVRAGNWDSSNIVTVKFHKDGDKLKGTYSLTTTINVGVGFKSKTSGEVELSGIVARNKEVTKTLKTYCDPVKQVEIIGSLIEDMESELRETINTIYVQKSEEIIDLARRNPSSVGNKMAQAQALKNAFMGGKRP